MPVLHQIILIGVKSDENLKFEAGTKEIGFEQDRNNKIGKNGTQNRVSEI